MDSNMYDDKILETYVSRCIDDIINHELIEGVTDVKSFAEFALPLEFDDERLVEGIGKGAAMAFNEIPEKSKDGLRFLAMSKSIKELSGETCTRRADKTEIWSGTLLELVHNRIRQRLKQEITANYTKE